MGSESFILPGNTLDRIGSEGKKKAEKLKISLYLMIT